MNFLLDENIPPSLTGILIQSGYSSLHVREVGLLSQADEKIFDYAFDNDMTIITHDLDFGKIHALKNQQKPSVILFRLDTLSVKILSALLEQYLEEIKQDLILGSIIVIEHEQIRIRKLPLGRLQLNQ